MTPAVNLIFPIPTAINEASTRWQKYQMEKLNEVMKEGEVKKKYKWNLFCRAYRVTTISLCAATCCAPFLLYDTLCCCVNICCCGGKSKAIYGCGFSCIKESCDEAFEDKREKEVAECGTRIDPVIYTSVCSAYMAAFDSCISMGKAREANIIRGNLVPLMKRYAPDLQCIMLRDDGDIEKLRNIIKAYENKYRTVVV